MIKFSVLLTKAINQRKYRVLNENEYGKYMLREFEFRFTCMNRDEACANVKDITKQINSKFTEVKDIKNTWYDHVGFIKLPSINQAEEIRSDIKKRAGDSLSSIIIRAR